MKGILLPELMNRFNFFHRLEMLNNAIIFFHIYFLNTLWFMGNSSKYINMTVHIMNSTKVHIFGTI